MMLIPYVLPMLLQTHVRGLFVVQEQFDPTEFAKLVEQSGIIPKKLIADYSTDYEEAAEYQGASIFRDVQLPWIIVIFKSVPREIRGTALHEIAHLADHMTCNSENRARFIEHVYMTFSDDLDVRLARQ
ncbi:hypothetical protein [Bradyrhizobium manausense]|nr:hypothetical protein [Bradyrhizobium manausense]